MLQRLALKSVSQGLKEASKAPRFLFSSGDAWKDRESSFEKQHFDKEDEKALRRLLSKLNKQTSKTDTKSHQSDVDSKHEHLKAIFAKYNLQSSEGLRKELIDWKLHDL